MTIPCANSTGKVVLDDDGLWWYLNDEDGVGQLVWHLAVPTALLRDLGANVVALVEALNARGLGLAVEGPRDLEQQVQRWRTNDIEGWR